MTPTSNNQARQRLSAARRGRGYEPQTPLPPKRLSPPRFRLLPLTMMMLVLLLGVKLHAVYLGGMQLQQMLAPGAQAQEDKKDDAAKDEAATEKNEGDDEGRNAGATETPPADAVKVEDEKAAAEKKDAKDEAKDEDTKDGASKPDDVKLASLEKPAIAGGKEEQHFSQIELDILQNLKTRREELEKQAGELDMKEKLLEATELRVNDKLNEMKGLQGQVEKLLQEYNTQEDNKLQGLVKIYENMKAKDAAQIFNELDMPILLEVVDRMSERKVAPILAGMDPMKAKELTVELAEFRKLRAVPRTLESAQQ